MRQSHPRRRFVGQAALAAAGAWGFPALRLHATPQRTRTDPFTLGVASGYPLPENVVLWTRLAPDVPAGGGLPPVPVPVQWELAHDERFARVARSGVAWARPDEAHSLHVEVNRLEPDRWYFYRFRQGGFASPVGRTRTAPRPDAAPERLRLAVCSCAHWEQGWFTAYRDVAQSGLDLCLHLGDYIYETSWGRDKVRHFPDASEVVTLEDYRARYALYRTDPDLQAAHAACPWLVTWDDHEVDNDYAGELSQDGDPREWFLARRAAAYQAYYEHMPLRRSQVPLAGHASLYARQGFGKLAWVFVTDGRQHRSQAPCNEPGYTGGREIDEPCPGLEDPQRSFFGAQQEAWLQRQFWRGGVTWNVLAQPNLVAPLDRRPGPGTRLWTDSWDGYPAARRRLMEQLAGAENPIVVGGDVHSFWVSDLRRVPEQPDSPVVAAEFVGSSITAGSGRTNAAVESVKPENPHVRFCEAEHRGYLRLELGRTEARAELRAVDDVLDPRSTVRTLAAFTVEAGRRGVRP